MKDFAHLDETKHMLDWLSDDPYEDIFEEAQHMLRQQVEGSSLSSFRVCSQPQWLTAGMEQPDDPDNMILSRTGVAFEFALEVAEPSGQTHQLKGTYSWVGINLDDRDRAQQNAWMDINEDLSIHGSEGSLQARMHFEQHG